LTGEPFGVLEQRDREPEGDGELAELLGGGLVPCPVSREAGAEAPGLGVEVRGPGSGGNGLDGGEQLLDLRRLAQCERRFDRLDDALLYGLVGDAEGAACFDGRLTIGERFLRLPFRPVEAGSRA
jgi:hypothetical protein